MTASADCARINLNAPEAVRVALAEVGRTEDVAVSEDGSRLALAAFSRNRIYVFSLRISRSEGAVRVGIPSCMVLTSEEFRQPHGCTFLDSEHLLICNRGGSVILVRLEEFVAGRRDVPVTPLARVEGGGYLRAVVKTPGSVAAYPIGRDRFRAYVCSDQWHFLTSHVVTLGDRPAIDDEGIRIQNTLQIPDGVSLSPDSEWIAVSNHVQGTVQLFRQSPALSRDGTPDAVLDGSVCPHGLSFDAAGNLYVADAASPYVHVYEQPASSWHDLREPSHSLRMLDDERFYAGRYAAREGGVKGVHVDRSTDVLITTHKLGTLEFYDLSRLRAERTRADPEQFDALRRERDYEIARTKTDVLNRQWRLRTRLRKELGAIREPLAANLRAVRPWLERSNLARRNRKSLDPLTVESGPVVSMTSHSSRIAHVHLAIESIAQGELRPGRLMLWLPQDSAGNRLPDSLRRLQERGLEVLYTADFGPHTKYYPYIDSRETLVEPLVTADDDIIYDRNWLSLLMGAHRDRPALIHCHRARRIRLVRQFFEPYNSWGPATDSDPHPLNFLIGASGVIYPPEFLLRLKRHGTGFQACCPQADDIWLNHVALRENFRVAQISAKWVHYAEIPASQPVALSRLNIGEGGNQIQLSRTYDVGDRARLCQLAECV